MKPFVDQVGIRKTQIAAILRSFSVVVFLLPLLIAETAYGDINAELVEAVYAGNIARVEQLVRKGAEVNAEQKNGWTVLEMSELTGHSEIVEILKQAGARQ